MGPEETNRAVCELRSEFFARFTEEFTLRAAATPRGEGSSEPARPACRPTPCCGFVLLGHSLIADRVVVGRRIWRTEHWDTTPSNTRRTVRRRGLVILGWHCAVAPVKMTAWPPTR
jgi:hypothetical protein